MQISVNAGFLQSAVLCDCIAVVLARPEPAAKLALGVGLAVARQSERGTSAAAILPQPGAGVVRYGRRMLQALVLGSAAGGGLPQWNCGCSNCARARAGELSGRSQDSVAISADGDGWFLLNASPDLGRQIERHPVLWAKQLRGSPIRGVVLTNGDLDHVLGLLLLRENQPLSVYATASVRAGLEQNAMLKTLERFEGQLIWHQLEYGRELPLCGADGRASGIFLRAFPAPGKPPLHLMSRAAPSAEDNCGLSLRADGGSRLVYASATADIAPIAGELEGAAVALIDGTFWSENELAERGLGSARAADMAHLPMSGPQGSLAQCGRLRVGQRYFTHINNTNPVLDPQSPERQTLEEHGFRLAEDGLTLSV